jgi:hypothetical protein
VEQREDNPPRERLGPSILKETIDRMAALGLPPSPEAFARAHADVSRRRELPVERQYTSELAALSHALAAFENLLIGNSWLNARFRELMRVTDDASVPERERLPRVRALLEEVRAGKPDAIAQAAQFVNETREAMTELIVEVRKLAEFVGASTASMNRALLLADDCLDVSDVRRAIDAIARDSRRINDGAKASASAITGTYSRFASAASPILGAGRTEPQRRAA